MSDFDDSYENGPKGGSNQPSTTPAATYEALKWRALKSATAFLKRGFKPIPERPDNRKPLLGNNWHEVEVTPKTLAKQFRFSDLNIGIQLGRAGKTVASGAPLILAFDEPPEPAEPRELPPELCAARAAMERVLRAYLDLGLDGFGTGGRGLLLEPEALDMFERARGWLFWRRKDPRQKGRVVYSYWLKHQAGHDIGYSRSGPFIAASITEGLRVRREDRRSPNAWITVKAGRLL